MQKDGVEEYFTSAKSEAPYVSCDLPLSPRDERSTQPHYTWNVSISNNNVTFSGGIELFVYDSTCLDCHNTSGSCVKKVVIPLNMLAVTPNCTTATCCRLSLIGQTISISPDVTYVASSHSNVVDKPTTIVGVLAACSLVQIGLYYSFRRWLTDGPKIITSAQWRS